MASVFAREIARTPAPEPDGRGEPAKPLARGNQRRLSALAPRVVVRPAMDDGAARVRRSRGADPRTAPVPDGGRAYVPPRRAA